MTSITSRGLKSAECLPKGEDSFELIGNPEDKTYQLLLDLKSKYEAKCKKVHDL